LKKLQKKKKPQACPDICEISPKGCQMSTDYRRQDLRKRKVTRLEWKKDGVMDDKSGNDDSTSYY